MRNGDIPVATNEIIEKYRVVSCHHPVIFVPDGRQKTINKRKIKDCVRRIQTQCAEISKTKDTPSRSQLIIEDLSGKKHSWDGFVDGRRIPTNPSSAF